MGRFERGLAKIPPREPADAAPPTVPGSDAASAPEVLSPIEAVRAAIAEHRATMTPFERYVNDELARCFTELLVGGSTTLGGVGRPAFDADAASARCATLTLDEALAMDGLA